jgi:hypothetical protein
MACVIDATDGGEFANSYCTIAEADAHFQARLHATEWPALTSDDKCRSLVWATRLLDEWVVWAGTAATYTQALAWPRWGLTTISGDVLSQYVVPEAVKQSTCELAWNLRLEDPTRTPEYQLSGLTNLTAGPVSLAWASPGSSAMLPSERILAPNVLGPIRRWVVSTQGSGFTAVPLGRA